MLIHCIVNLILSVNYKPKRFDNFLSVNQFLALLKFIEQTFKGSNVSGISINISLLTCVGHRLGFVIIYLLP